MHVELPARATQHLHRPTQLAHSKNIYPLLLSLTTHTVKRLIRSQLSRMDLELAHTTSLCI